MTDNRIGAPITLPCGVTLKNRLVKAAMTERIADKNNQAVKNHERLYETWADTGAGLLITGNVIIDRKHLESAGNVVFDENTDIDKLSSWAESGKKNGTHIWVQISHGGRQTNMINAFRPKAPSAVKLKKLGLFGKPKAMTEADIQQVFEGFVRAAKIAKQAGFTGVQFHSAHGYLLSQFLSPITNKRTDRWGGSLENRSRLLRDIVHAARQELGPDFPISVKLNSSDFQKGGFTEEESLEVVKMLDKAGIDLLEISGGTYDKVAFFMMNDEAGEMRESTKVREAYFLKFAEKIRAVSQIPLMITGGFRTYDFCNEALAKEELELIGMARPFVTNVEDIPGFLSGQIKQFDNLVLRTGYKVIDDLAEGGFYAKQIIQMSRDERTNLKMSPMAASWFFLTYEIIKGIFRKLFR
jgi:2,4-dienoyl-CoA reductase-like NADH-dependent reductase (Old Yellow Enzyme family)